MARALEYLDEALEEAEAAARWYAERSPTAAFALHRFPFSVVYRVERDRVLFVAVVHAHWRPGYWKSRTPE